MHSNTAFVRTEKTKQRVAPVKPVYAGKQASKSWQRTDNKRTSFND